MDAAQLKKIPLFANLTTDHLQKVGAIATQKQLKANERVFQEGDVGTEMYIIASGKVRISKMVQGVGEEALAVLEPGSYFGEMALIDDTPRSADATAHLACTKTSRTSCSGRSCARSRRGCARRTTRSRRSSRSRRGSESATVLRWVRAFGRPLWCTSL